jgi:hypothetical protein
MRKKLMCSIQGFHSGFSQFGPLSQDFRDNTNEGMRDERGGQCGTQLGMTLPISLLYRSFYCSGWAGLGIQQQK